MDMGIGLDTTLRLSWSDHDTLIREAAHLGYGSAWTPSQATSRDAFHVCSRWNAASSEIIGGGIGARHLGRAGSSLVARHSGLTRGNSRRAQRRPIHSWHRDRRDLQRGLSPDLGETGVAARCDDAGLCFHGAFAPGRGDHRS